MLSGVYDQSGIEAAGAWIAARLRQGDAILLSGPLGAGKSTLARALIRAACGDPALDVPSPSYTLVQSFSADSLVHGPDGLAELGWEEARQGVVIVEWPDRLGQLGPSGALEVELRMAQGDTRQLTAHGWPDRLTA